MEGYITEKGGCYREDRYWFFRLREECKAVGLLGLTTVALYLRLERKSSINKMVAELPPISQKWPNSPDGKSYVDRLIKVEKISDSCLRFDGIGARRH